MKTFQEFLKLKEGLFYSDGQTPERRPKAKGPLKTPTGASSAGIIPSAGGGAAAPAGGKKMKKKMKKK